MGRKETMIPKLNGLVRSRISESYQFPLDQRIIALSVHYFSQLVWLVPNRTSIPQPNSRKEMKTAK